MNASHEPQARELVRRLAEAEATIEALLSGQIDAVVDSRTQTPVLLAKAQDALRQERDRAQQYLDTAEVILLALDLNGRIGLVNRYACSVLGWTSDELRERDWFETCVPARLRDTARSWFHNLLGGDLSVAETPVLTRSGEERLIEFRSSLSRDDAGQVTGTLSSGSDITQRRRAEEATLQGAQLSALSAAVGLSLTKSDSLAVALQRCAEALVTHLGAAFARIWTLNEREGVLELRASAGLYTHLDGPHARVPLGQFAIGRIARNRTPYLSNRVIDDPEVSDLEGARREGMAAFAGHPLIVDGRVIGVMALFARHALSEGVFLALASVADHISLGIERHWSAESLRETEQRMSFALESANVGVWDSDPITGTARWSEILEAQFGLEPGTFAGTFQAFIERVHPSDRESLLDTITKAMKSGADFSVQYRPLRPDGEVRWLTNDGRFQLGENGEALRGLGISQDVTGRRTLEAQMQQAQKMEVVGQLAGSVAHDFNNLLTVILGVCELLLADWDPADRRHADIAEIQGAATRAAGLTRQLLAFSRKQIIEPTLLDLNEVMAGMQAMLGRLIGEDVTVVLNPGPELPLVKADRGQIEQAIMNLAVNARDAMPKGGMLTIETGHVELDEDDAERRPPLKPGPYVTLTVTDTGFGMTPQVQACVFEPFFTTKELGKGTGLGLATVHGFMAGSGGGVTVRSEVGKGTSFTLHFPQADAAGTGIDAPVPVARLRRRAETLLVVEDKAALREVTRRMLQRQGFTVLVAADADEAFRLFEQNAPVDLLLSDVVMPGTSGPELVRQLVERRPALKVLYMSGYADEALVPHSVLKSGVAFLPKPFTSETLGRKVREVLESVGSGVSGWPEGQHSVPLLSAAGLLLGRLLGRAGRLLLGVRRLRRRSARGRRGRRRRGRGGRR